MQSDPNAPIATEKLAAIARELRLIRILLYAFLLLIASAMSSGIDRDMPPIVLLVGLLAPILWSVAEAWMARSRRARHEAETFRRLSGKSDHSAG